MGVYLYIVFHKNPIEKTSAAPIGRNSTALFLPPGMTFNAQYPETNEPTEAPHVSRERFIESVTFSLDTSRE
jgi:hypothetical protein